MYALPVLKFVTCILDKPLAYPPVITALPVLKLLTWMFASPVAYPPLITALPVLKLLTWMFASPVAYPPLITALPVLKLVAVKVPIVPSPVIYGWLAVNTLPYMLPTNPPDNVPAPMLPVALKLEKAAPTIVAPVKLIWPVTVAFVTPSDVP